MGLLRKGGRGLAGVALTAALLLSLGCGQGSSGPAGGELQVVSLTATEFRFAPAEVSLRAGVPARLVLANQGMLEHDVTVIGLEPSTTASREHSMPAMGHMMDEMPSGTVHASAASGQQASVDFTPTTGTYEFYCAVAGHREAGMRGTLRVL